MGGGERRAVDRGQVLEVSRGGRGGGGGGGEEGCGQRAGPGGEPEGGLLGPEETLLACLSAGRPFQLCTATQLIGLLFH